MVVTIPGLPEHLRTVPPAPDSAVDPAAEEKRRVWRAWARAVAADNLRHQEALAGHPEAIGAELKRCAAHPAYFLARWCQIFEPRAGRRLGGFKPFVPAARQVELLDWLVDRLADEETERGDGVVSKSRAVGASWVVCAFVVWGWLFRTPFSALLMSWKEEFVDSKQQKALFWKIDRILRGLPTWMLPAGYDPHRKPYEFRQDRFILNPANDNEIAGETTTSTAARGTRATVMFFDEAAFMDKFQRIWDGATASTDHRIAVSSESFEKGRDFYDLGMGNKSPVAPALFGFDWWQFPVNDETWYERERKRFAKNPEAFENEYGRNPHAGTTTWVYADAWDKEPDPAIRYDPNVGDLYGGIDPGFSDKFAMVWVQHDPLANTWNVLDAYTNAGRVADYYASIINGEFETGHGRYDDEALRLMAWTITLGPVKWWGDTYGDNTLGATTDTIYTRLRDKGIHVNRRRTGEKEQSATLKAATSYRGRQEAVRDYLPRLRFADTPGARLMLSAMQYHKYPDDVQSRMSEPNKPVHDWTSHLCAALEYVFVNVKLRQKAAANPIAAPTRVGMGLGAPASRFAQVGRVA